jgi:two-component system sensor histidine kinase KdpD
MLYVLAVALSSAIGGAAAGVAASFLSFLALNFFFMPPLHTFAVGKPGDLIALLAFLVVSAITGLLLSAVLMQKSRAERREVQTRLVNRFTNRLLSGHPLDAVLRDLAESLVELFGLASCEITTEITEPVSSVAGNKRPGESFEVDLTSKVGPIGTMWVTLPDSGVLSTTTRGPCFVVLRDRSPLLWKAFD